MPLKSADANKLYFKATLNGFPHAYVAADFGQSRFSCVALPALACGQDGGRKQARVWRGFRLVAGRQPEVASLGVQLLATDSATDSAYFAQQLLQVGDVAYGDTCAAFPLVRLEWTRMDEQGQPQTFSTKGVIQPSGAYFQILRYKWVKPSANEFYMYIEGRFRAQFVSADGRQMLDAHQGMLSGYLQLLP